VETTFIKKISNPITLKELLYLINKNTILKNYSEKENEAMDSVIGSIL